MPIQVVLFRLATCPFHAISPHRIMLEKQYVLKFHDGHPSRGEYGSERVKEIANRLP